MTKVFLAIKYEGNEKLQELIQNELREQGIEPVTGEEIASNPPPPVIRAQIFASDGLLAVIYHTHKNPTDDFRSHGINCS